MFNIEEINPDWIRGKMKETGISQSEIVKFSTIDKQAISAWLNGRNKMSKSAKIMFYLIFSFPERVKEILTNGSN